MQDHDYLQSVFLMTDSICDQFDRLNAAYSWPMTKVHLLFYQSVLQFFNSLNEFLQWEEPNIPEVYDQIHVFMKKLLASLWSYLKSDHLEEMFPK